ncbi:type I restriction enzyme, S subunit [Butyrivibrio proteoclasticus]|uniref:Type I restriction enzyme, S subunit n=1 Tax=Butyrivibrio proteoclasticus TaxID=43305 RepID=A0A1I5WV65_9FIRM|nr:restriction endonuclease subunit S [Butyrivibrio proteoclasticus]SFQ23508.1 type I restriction enzyme, S subunit [Butyrivibrio proteoclasticus]
MATLRDYIKIKHGYAFKGKNISTIDNNIVLVTPGNFAIGGGFKEEKCKYFDAEYPDDYVLKEDDLIVTMTDLSKAIDTLGYSALVPKSKGNRIYLHNQRIGLISIETDSLDKHYLYWFMRSPYYQRTIASTSTGSTVHHTSPDRIMDIEIDLPELIEQKKIAGLLDNIEEKIAINNEVNKNLQAQAFALYSQIIIDNADNTWTPGVLSDIADITMGQSPKGDTYNEDGVGTVFFQGRAEFGFRFPTRRLYTTAPKRMALANDTLMSVRAPVGDINVAYEDCCIGRGLASIHSKDNHQSYVLYTMFNLRKQLHIFNGEGTVFGSINKDSLNTMPIVIPPIKVIDTFGEIVAPMDNAIRNNYAEICHLTNIRDSLLPRLMSGELDVSDIDI